MAHLNFSSMNASDIFNMSSIDSTLITDNNGSSMTVLMDVGVPQAIGTAVALGVIMLGTMVGNILVILSVFTYKPLRNVQNIFLVSLAAADIAVAFFVMPFNVAYSILGRWVFGLHVCKLWLTCDVLCCTASILNLCAIALDRYWAIHDPIRYAQKRTLNRVLTMICSVWIISVLISVPPLIGWNDWPEEFSHCQLTAEKGYVIYSASGSFFIPLVIMTVVYIKIFQTARNRIRVKAKAAAKILSQDGGSSSAKTTLLSHVKTVSAEVSDKDNCNLLSIELEDKPLTSQTSSRKETHGNGCGEERQKTPTTSAVTIMSCTEAKTADKISSQDDSSSSAKTTHITSVSADVSDKDNSSSIQLKDKPVISSRKENGCGEERQAVTVKSYMEQKERICLQKERRAAQVLGIVMGVFVLCWLPFFTMYVILPFCGEWCEISGDMVNFITWLGYMNSALNPVIYTVFNVDFRRSFQRLLFGKRRYR